MRVTGGQARAAANRFSEALGQALGDEVEGWLIRHDGDEEDPEVNLLAVACTRLELIDEERDDEWDLVDSIVAGDSIWPLLQALLPFTPPGGGLGWGSVSVNGGDHIPSDDQLLWEDA